MSDVNQDDIDKMLQDALGGGGVEEEPPAAPESEDERGPASQDDIDALFAAVGTGNLDPASLPSPAEPEPAPAMADDMVGMANQDDIDALFASVGGGDSDGAAPVASEPEPDVAAHEDLDEFLKDTNALDSKEMPEANTADLDELLASIAIPDGGGDATGDGPPLDQTIRVDDFDMEELLKQVSEAAPPPPPTKPTRVEERDSEDTAIIDMAQEMAQRAAEAPAAPPAAAPAPAAPPPRTLPAAPATAQLPPMPQLPPPDTGPRQEYSVLHGAGEVESLANQVGGLVATLSEKAHRYMQAWIAADGEARELRSRALMEERRRTSLTSEKEVLSRELDELRSRIGELEGGKLAWEEARRTLETSFQAKIRELESQVKLLDAEAESLKDELTRARNQATGVDIESRRVRFEVDRLKNEAESERMERLRIQRALENREKEIQAMQAQASGQASSLFIDELHRLVRRLESELEARSSGAHEALKQLDRLETTEAQVPVVANLRAALMHAVGADDNPDDALKALGREASGIKGPAAIAPGKAEVVSFETAISTYNLSGAIDIAGALLREAKGTPNLLMRKIYQCPALRRPELAEHLTELSTLLEGLRIVQESSDRARGKESGDSEVFYVQMFDYLHNMVRLKLINRMSGEIWRLFLDLRGRFSFVTSDKQWAEYRDKTLNDKSA